MSNNKKEYHKYIFNVHKRKFVGKFEEMYQAEQIEKFDSWYQEDTRHLPRKILLDIIDDFSFTNIIDIGCGKGSLTHVLKKQNNDVTGIDISSTAILQAQKRYPDINFTCMDLTETNNFCTFIHKIKNPVDLICAREILSYLKNWKDILKRISDFTHYLIIGLDIPENAIGFVKSERELCDTVEKYFDIIECITLKKSYHSIIFAKSKKNFPMINR